MNDTTASVQDSYESFFKAAYEKERIKNMNLTGALLDAEQERDELLAKLGRITTSAPYKLYKKLRGNGSAHERKNGKPVKELPYGYVKELGQQSDPYLAMIKQNEKGRQKSSQKDTDHVFLSYRELADLFLSGKNAGKDVIAAEDRDSLDPDAKEYINDFFLSKNDKGIWFCDEDETDEDGKRINPWFKPEWSVFSLQGAFIPGSLFAIKKENCNEAFSWLRDKGFDKGSYGDDGRETVYLIILAASLYTSAVHEDAVLCHRKGKKATFSSKLETTVSADYAERTGFWGYEERFARIKSAFYEASTGLKMQIRRGLDDRIFTVYPILSPKPLISVIIPSKDNPELLSKLLGSFFEDNGYGNVEFIIVDNGSNPENKAKAESLLASYSEKHKKRMDYLYKKEAFNFSAMCNRGAASSGGELLLFLNDDMECIDGSWLDVMAGQAMTDGTGAVGASLRYPGEFRFQHAGISNLKVGPSHKLINFPDDRIYYYGAGAIPMEMSAVTGACLMVKKRDFYAVGGFDEELPVEYNDVALCFSLFEKGLHNVIRNDAVLIHKESISRGKKENDGEYSLHLIEEQDKLYKKHPFFADGNDPALNIHISQDSPEYKPDVVFPAYDPRAFSEEREAFKGQTYESLLCVTLERAGLQLKRRDAREDTIKIEGWSFVKGRDNSVFTESERLISLTDDKGGVRYFSVFDVYRYDVELVMENECNVALAGFVCRIRKADLLPGHYSIGFMCRDGSMVYSAKAVGEVTV